MQTMVLDQRLDGRTRAETPELVARASTGDQVAWDQLVERYGGMVWAVARAHGLGPADAADVSQVTWLLLVQQLDTRQQPERVGVWLLRTATREAYRMRRLRGYEAPVAKPFLAQTPLTVGQSGPESGWRAAPSSPWSAKDSV